MTEIVDIRALEILDSRGNPTVEAQVTLALRCVDLPANCHPRRFHQTH